MKTGNVLYGKLIIVLLGCILHLDMAGEKKHFSVLMTAETAGEKKREEGERWLLIAVSEVDIHQEAMLLLK